MLLSWVICRASPGASLSGPGTVSVDTRQSHWPQGSLTGQSSRGSLAPAMLCSIAGPDLEHSVHDGVRAMGTFLGIGSGTLSEFQRGGGSSNYVNYLVDSRQREIFLIQFLLHCESQGGVSKTETFLGPCWGPSVQTDPQ